MLFHCQMECWLETADVMNFKNGKRRSQFASAALRGVNLRITDRGIPKHRDARQFGDCCPQEFEVLAD